MRLPRHRTRIVCTIGPASQAPATLRRMLLAGMDVARLNLAHGDLETHARWIAALRAAAEDTGRTLAILADLPGPKLRIGRLPTEVMMLRRSESVLLGPIAAPATAALTHIPMDQPKLLAGSTPGEDLFLNDGFLQLRIRRVTEAGIEAHVIVGGELRSHKGINAPSLILEGGAFTDEDRRLLDFALELGVDAIGLSFVQGPEDVLAARAAAAARGHHPWLVAKIERAAALKHLDAILDVADALMVARGDLGVETPIEAIALVQKRLIARANRAGKPVITATQMLESMTRNRRPTRAEATDVANAVLDGTDAVMLSEESAAGAYPVPAVRMLARIAAHAEAEPQAAAATQPAGHSLEAVIAAAAVEAAARLRALLIVTPTRTGATARRIARLRPRAWIIAFCHDIAICRRLTFSRGVHPVHVSSNNTAWDAVIDEWLAHHYPRGHGPIVITQGPSRDHPDGISRVALRPATPYVPHATANGDSE
ncbi:pyruvate kinase [Acidihalobacter yilgarnensis]|uniref:Pyruvate kinase n=1 Tax=Acidihalobacter yilgarnensis TaxID=2819280 RepID=A0A1D8IMJ0_9GAMM|nr:pyruvate kinase [Acidihalobacter yilgarnensis]AOU97678.1 pyruvate kinase [Acidihalobacter yilgarnensis]